jgi:hypothetical protein
VKKWFQDPVNKKALLSYDGLQVWDANNKMLDARMEFDVAYRTLILVVDDPAAMYPVTIGSPE